MHALRLSQRMMGRHKTNNCGELAGDEIVMSSPEPAVSKVVHATVQTHTGRELSRKRAKALEAAIRDGVRKARRLSGSTDELQEDMPPLKIARTSMAGRSATRIRSSSESFGDSESLSTVSSKQRHDKKPHRTLYRFELDAAVAGQQSYLSSSDGRLFLAVGGNGGSVIRPWFENGAEATLQYPWLEIDLKACAAIQCAREPGAYIKIRGGNRIAYVLALRVVSDRVGGYFRSYISSLDVADKLKDADYHQLCKTFQNMHDKFETWRKSSTTRVKSVRADLPSLERPAKRARKLSITSDPPSPVHHVTEKEMGGKSLRAGMLSGSPLLAPATSTETTTSPAAHTPTVKVITSVQAEKSPNSTPQKESVTRKFTPRPARRLLSALVVDDDDDDDAADDDDVSTIFGFTSGKSKTNVWTRLNRDWEDGWGKNPLTYQRTQVEKSDIPRLNDGEFLNDNIIAFYLRYLFDQATEHNPLLPKKVLMMNTFFYQKLKPVGKSPINYDGVKKWYAKVDVSSFDYIVVPINEDYHWFLLIVCNTPLLLQDAQPDTDVEEALVETPVVDITSDKPPKKDTDVQETLRDQWAVAESSIESAVADLAITEGTPKLKHRHVHVKSDSAIEEATNKAAGVHRGRQLTRNSNVSSTHVGDGDVSISAKQEEPVAVKSSGEQLPFKILVLDSLEVGHAKAVAHIKEFIFRDILEKKKLRVQLPSKVGWKVANIPTQFNHTDCGVFLLAYTSKFLQDPDAFTRSILKKELRKWPVDASGLRAEIRNLILRLRSEQKWEEDEKESRLKKKKKTAKVNGNRTSLPAALDSRAVVKRATGSLSDSPSQISL